MTKLQPSHLEQSRPNPHLYPMRFLQKLSLTLFAAAALSGCDIPLFSSNEPLPLQPGTTFRIHSVLLGADGMALEQLPDELVLGETAQRFTDDAGQSYFFSLPAVIDESCLSGLSASKNPVGSGAVLNFRLTDDCAKTFGEYTAKNLGTDMAIVLNGELKTVSRINAAIMGGMGYVGGFDSLAEAKGVAETFY